VWTSKFGETAAFARSQRETVRSLGVVIGVRFWF
jgi:uncharacterized protein involved in copper resistance